MAGYLQDLLSGVLGVAEEYVGDGVRVSVATNYTGEIPVAKTRLGLGGGGGADREPSALSRLFGVRASVIVRNARGEVISTFGEDVKPDPLRVVVALSVASGLLWLLYRGATR